MKKIYYKLIKILKKNFYCIIRTLYNLNLIMIQIIINQICLKNITTIIIKNNSTKIMKYIKKNHLIIIKILQIEI